MELLKTRRVLVYHVGARDKYSIAAFFAAKGNLDCLITDYWWSSLFWLLPQRYRKIANRRFENSLKSDQVVSYNVWKLVSNILLKRVKKNHFQKWMFSDTNFTKFVIRNVKKQAYKPDIVWGYTSANLEVLEYYDALKTFKVHNQIDPGLEYYDLQQSIWASNKDLEYPPVEIPQLYRERLLREWSLADLIIVNSTYSKKCLIKHGVEKSKIEVLPLIFDGDSSRETKSFGEKLTIGFIGNISLMKGFDVFINAASELKGAFNFVAIGQFRMKSDVKRITSEFINFVGHIPKSEMDDWYSKIDILAFPTRCDGFGMVQLEAMSNGIPVIATEYCGSVVKEGYNGEIIRAQSELTTMLLRLQNDRELLERYSRNARKTIVDYSRLRFNDRLEAILRNRLC